jgi:hypothetical protein
MSFGKDFMECIRNSIVAYELFGYQSMIFNTDPKLIELFTPYKDQMMLYPLYNSYIIPSQTFDIIMPWVSHIFFSTPLEQEHLPCFFERVMAFAIGQQNLPLRQIKEHVNHVGYD